MDSFYRRVMSRSEGLHFFDVPESVENQLMYFDHLGFKHQSSELQDELRCFFQTLFQLTRNNVDVAPFFLIPHFDHIIGRFMEIEFDVLPFYINTFIGYGGFDILFELLDSLHERIINTSIAALSLHPNRRNDVTNVAEVRMAFDLVYYTLVLIREIIVYSSSSRSKPLISYSILASVIQYFRYPIVASVAIHVAEELMYQSRQEFSIEKFKDEDIDLIELLLLLSPNDLALACGFLSCVISNADERYYVGSSMYTMRRYLRSLSLKIEEEISVGKLSKEGTPLRADEVRVEDRTLRSSVNHLDGISNSEPSARVSEYLMQSPTTLSNIVALMRGGDGTLLQRILAVSTVSRSNVNVPSLYAPFFRQSAHEMHSPVMPENVGTGVWPPYERLRWDLHSQIKTRRGVEERRNPLSEYRNFTSDRNHYRDYQLSTLRGRAYAEEEDDDDESIDPDIDSNIVDTVNGSIRHIPEAPPGSRRSTIADSEFGSRATRSVNGKAFLMPHSAQHRQSGLYYRRNRRVTMFNLSPIKKVRLTTEILGKVHVNGFHGLRHYERAYLHWSARQGPSRLISTVGSDSNTHLNGNAAVGSAGPILRQSTRAQLVLDGAFERAAKIAEADNLVLRSLRRLSRMATQVVEKQRKKKAEGRRMRKLAAGTDHGAEDTGNSSDSSLFSSSTPPARTENEVEVEEKMSPSDSDSSEFEEETVEERGDGWVRVGQCRLFRSQRLSKSESIRPDFVANWEMRNKFGRKAKGFTRRLDQRFLMEKKYFERVLTGVGLGLGTGTRIPISKWFHKKYIRPAPMGGDMKKADVRGDDDEIEPQNLLDDVLIDIERNIGSQSVLFGETLQKESLRIEKKRLSRLPVFPKNRVNLEKDARKEYLSRRFLGSWTQRTMSGRSASVVKYRSIHRKLFSPNPALKFLVDVAAPAGDRQRYRHGRSHWLRHVRRFVESLDRVTLKRYRRKLPLVSNHFSSHFLRRYYAVGGQMDRDRAASARLADPSDTHKAVCNDSALYLQLRLNDQFLMDSVRSAVRLKHKRVLETSLPVSEALEAALTAPLSLRDCVDAMLNGREGFSTFANQLMKDTAHSDFKMLLTEKNDSPLDLESSLLSVSLLPCMVGSTSRRIRLEVGKNGRRHRFLLDKHFLPDNGDQLRLYSESERAVDPVIDLSTRVVSSSIGHTMYANFCTDTENDLRHNTLSVGALKNLPDSIVREELDRKDDQETDFDKELRRAMFPVIISCANKRRFANPQSLQFCDMAVALSHSSSHKAFVKQLEMRADSSIRSFISENVSDPDLVLQYPLSSGCCFPYEGGRSTHSSSPHVTVSPSNSYSDTSILSDPRIGFLSARVEQRLFLISVRCSYQYRRHESPLLFLGSSGALPVRRTSVEDEAVRRSWELFFHFYARPHEMLDAANYANDLVQARPLRNSMAVRSTGRAAHNDLNGGDNESNNRRSSIVEKIDNFNFAVLSGADEVKDEFLLGMPQKLTFLDTEASPGSSEIRISYQFPTTVSQGFTDVDSYSLLSNHRASHYETPWMLQELPGVGEVVLKGANVPNDILKKLKKLNPSSLKNSEISASVSIPTNVSDYLFSAAIASLTLKDKNDPLSSEERSEGELILDRLERSIPSLPDLPDSLKALLSSKTFAELGLHPESVRHLYPILQENERNLWDRVVRQNLHHGLIIPPGPAVPSATDIPLAIQSNVALQNSQFQALFSLYCFSNSPISPIVADYTAVLGMQNAAFLKIVDTIWRANATIGMPEERKRFISHDYHPLLASLNDERPCTCGAGCSHNFHSVRQIEVNYALQSLTVFCNRTSNNPASNWRLRKRYLGSDELLFSNSKQITQLMEQDVKGVGADNTSANQPVVDFESQDSYLITYPNPAAYDDSAVLLEGLRTLSCRPWGFLVPVLLPKTADEKDIENSKKISTSNNIAFVQLNGSQGSAYRAVWGIDPESDTELLNKAKDQVAEKMIKQHSPNSLVLDFKNELFPSPSDTKSFHVIDTVMSERNAFGLPQEDIMAPNEAMDSVDSSINGIDSRYNHIIQEFKSGSVTSSSIDFSKLTSHDLHMILLSDNGLLITEKLQIMQSYQNWMRSNDLTETVSSTSADPSLLNMFIDFFKPLMGHNVDLVCRTDSADVYSLPSGPVDFLKKLREALLLEMQIEKDVESGDIGKIFESEVVNVTDFSQPDMKSKISSVRSRTGEGVNSAEFDVDSLLSSLKSRALRLQSGPVGTFAMFLSIISSSSPYFIDMVRFMNVFLKSSPLGVRTMVQSFGVLRRLSVIIMKSIVHRNMMKSVDYMKNVIMKCGAEVESSRKHESKKSSNVQKASDSANVRLPFGATIRSSNEGVSERRRRLWELVSRVHTLIGDHFAYSDDSRASHSLVAADDANLWDSLSQELSDVFYDYNRYGDSIRSPNSLLLLSTAFSYVRMQQSALLMHPVASPEPVEASRRLFQLQYDYDSDQFFEGDAVVAVSQYTSSVHSAALQAPPSSVRNRGYLHQRPSAVMRDVPLGAHPHDIHVSDPGGSDDELLPFDPSEETEVDAGPSQEWSIERMLAQLGRTGQHAEEMLGSLLGRDRGGSTRSASRTNSDGKGNDDGSESEGTTDCDDPVAEYELQHYHDYSLLPTETPQDNGYYSENESIDEEDNCIDQTAVAKFLTRVPLTLSKVKYANNIVNKSSNRYRTLKKEKGAMIKQVVSSSSPNSSHIVEVNEDNFESFDSGHEEDTSDIESYSSDMMPSAVRKGFFHHDLDCPFFNNSSSSHESKRCSCVGFAIAPMSADIPAGYALNIVRNNRVPGVYVTDSSDTDSGSDEATVPVSKQSSIVEIANSSGSPSKRFRLPLSYLRRSVYYRIVSPQIRHYRKGVQLQNLLIRSTDTKELKPSYESNADSKSLVSSEVFSNSKLHYFDHWGTVASLDLGVFSDGEGKKLANLYVPFPMDYRTSFPTYHIDENPESDATSLVSSLEARFTETYTDCLNGLFTPSTFFHQTRLNQGILFRTATPGFRARDTYRTRLVRWLRREGIKKLKSSSAPSTADTSPVTVAAEPVSEEESTSEELDDAIEEPGSEVSDTEPSEVDVSPASRQGPKAISILLTGKSIDVDLLTNSLIHPEVRVGAHDPLYITSNPCVHPEIVDARRFPIENRESDHFDFDEFDVPDTSSNREDSVIGGDSVSSSKSDAVGTVETSPPNEAGMTKLTEKQAALISPAVDVSETLRTAYGINETSSNEKHEMGTQEKSIAFQLLSTLIVRNRLGLAEFDKFWFGPRICYPSSSLSFDDDLVPIPSREELQFYQLDAFSLLLDDSKLGASQSWWRKNQEVSLMNGTIPGSATSSASGNAISPGSDELSSAVGANSSWSISIPYMDKFSESLSTFDVHPAAAGGSTTFVPQQAQILRVHNIPIALADSLFPRVFEKEIPVPLLQSLVGLEDWALGLFLTEASVDCDGLHPVMSVLPPKVALEQIMQDEDAIMLESYLKDRPQDSDPYSWFQLHLSSIKLISENMGRAFSRFPPKLSETTAGCADALSYDFSIPVPTFIDWYGFVDNFIMQSDSISFMRKYRVPIIVKLLDSLIPNDSTKPNLTVFETILTFFVIAHKNGALPALICCIKNYILRVYEVKQKEERSNEDPTTELNNGNHSINNEGNIASDVKESVVNGCENDECKSGCNPSVTKAEQKVKDEEHFLNHHSRISSISYLTLPQFADPLLPPGIRLSVPSTTQKSLKVEDMLGSFDDIVDYGKLSIVSKPLRSFQTFLELGASWLSMQSLRNTDNFFQTKHLLSFGDCRFVLRMMLGLDPCVNSNPSDVPYSRVFSPSGGGETSFNKQQSIYENSLHQGDMPRVMRALRSISASSGFTSASTNALMNDILYDNDSTIWDNDLKKFLLTPFSPDAMKQLRLGLRTKIQEISPDMFALSDDDCDKVILDAYVNSCRLL